MLKSGFTEKHFLLINPSSYLPSAQKDNLASIQKALKVVRDYGPDRLDQPRRLVLTTYETLSDYQFSLCRVDWSLVIFDEAQMVKNPNTLASRAAKGLKARFKLAVTGTPVENSLRDFWNLLDTVRTGHLDAYQPFNREFIRPINRVPREQRAHERQQIGLQLRAKTGLVMLRRNKVDKLEGLPVKTIYTGVEDQSPNTRFYAPLQCTMQREQADVYDRVVANVREQAANENAGNPFLAGLQRLRDVALHPALLDGGILPRPQSREQAQRLIGESSIQHPASSHALSVCSRLFRKKTRKPLFLPSTSARRSLWPPPVSNYSLFVCTLSTATPKPWRAGAARLPGAG